MDDRTPSLARAPRGVPHWRRFLAGLGHAETGQGEGLPLDKVGVVLQALARALADLPQLPGWAAGGQTFGLEITRTWVNVDLPGGGWSADQPAIEVRAWLEDSWEGRSVSQWVYYLEGDAATVDDVVLTTLGQVQQAGEYAGGFFVPYLDDVGPQNFAGLLELAYLALTL